MKLSLFKKHRRKFGEKYNLFCAGCGEKATTKIDMEEIKYSTFTGRINKMIISYNAICETDKCACKWDTLKVRFITIPKKYYRTMLLIHYGPERCEAGILEKV